MVSEILEIFHIFHIPALGIRVRWPGAGIALGKNMCASRGRRMPRAEIGRARYVENTWRLSNFIDHVEGRCHSEILACRQ